MSPTYTEGPYKSFEEETLGALVGKEGFAVMLGAADNTVKLATSAAVAIGVLFGRNTLETKEVNVRLFGGGGSLKVKAGGVIAKDARVTWGAGGTFVTLPAAAGTYRCFGRRLEQGSSANGDLMEILDQLETVIVP